MLSGFNTNLRHRGVLFHVQTEDSGRSNPHIISHLFHGGNILVSRKSEYQDLLESEEISDKVRELMESQHKDMLRNLLRGGCDDRILERLGPDAFSDVASDGQASEGLFSERDLEPLMAAELEAVRSKSRREAAIKGTPAPDPAQPAMGPPAGPESSKERIARAFGDGVVSQKPLDEVVLDFLVANARKRKRPPS